MTIETLDTEGDDDYDVDGAESVPDCAADPRAEIEAFTGTTLEHLMRVGYSVSARKLQKREDREDTVQEAFVRLISVARRQPALPQHPGAERAAAYFARIVLSVIIDNWKQEVAAKRGGGAAVLALDNEIHVEDPRPMPPHHAQMRELRTRILTAVETLPPGHRAVAELALDIDSGDFSRLSHSEISERLGLPIKTVKSRIHEIKKKLAICLADWKEEQ
ncbi:RNA polymerase sigma factor [Pseudarthrobacter sp. lyk4-40-TYG-27]|uniref:RNA polymerase sigma factor n=1 Tax=Pseudarthrobacter sp. lyk4-40-TYG-27 TaxID=3040305 RepID=UPI002554EE54|nr:RNA polymerase sigma factor [Pseudarthrobacter sp. lyk4-40-TYG-27]